MKFTLFIICIVIIIFVIISTVLLCKKKEKLVVSLTTSPKRITKIKPMLDSIIAQTYKPDRIILNLPKIFERTGERFNLPLPDFITNNKLIHVNFCDDIGPATKIISSLSLINNHDTYILSVDDDIYYPPYICELYIKYAQLFPNCIISGVSFINNVDTNDNKWFYKTIKKIPNFNGKIVDILEGHSGVLYRRDYFTKELLNDFYKHLKIKSCKLGDDFYLSNLFKKWRVKIISIGINVSYNSFNPHFISTFNYGLKDDALHKQTQDNDNCSQNFQNCNDGNHNNYRNCSKYLDSKNELYINYYL